MKYIIANWKANKNNTEVGSWISEFLSNIKSKTEILAALSNNRLKIIICPPYPFIEQSKIALTHMPNISIGAQNISDHENGKYTGEVTAHMLNGLVDYTIIGHIERRLYFHEDKDMLIKKIQLAKQYNIEPIFCFSERSELVLDSAINIFAFEPSSAVGSGINEPVERVLQSKKNFDLPVKSLFIYGGSVDEKDMLGYCTSHEIDGLLIGSASLNPIRFLNIVAIYAASV